MAAASSSRWTRLQFSLRGMLLAITVTGIGLVFYSPTWEEPLDAATANAIIVGKTSNKFISGTVSYRRGWDRKRVKHGWTYVDYQNACRLEALFENDELRQLRQLRNGQRVEETFFQGGTTRKRTFSGGQLTKDITYSGSKMHGKFWSNEKGTLNSGSYLSDEREGVWNFTFPNGATVTGPYREGQKEGPWHTITPTGTIEANYQADKLHGRKRWLTPTGRELQSADYGEDKLVGWNGNPLAEEVARWVEQEFAADPLLRINLLRADTKPEDWEIRELPNDEAGYCLDKSSLPITVHLSSAPRISPPSRWRLPNKISDDDFYLLIYDERDRKGSRSFAEVLLTGALARQCTLQNRFGMLHVVPITPAEIDWQDRTGVTDIHFSKGSPAEADWLSLGVLPVVYKDRTVDLLHRMFDQRFGSPILVDTTAVDDLEPPVTESTHQKVKTVPRIRRDLVGQYLDRSGFCCELRGETLVIKPQAGRKQMNPTKP